ncbi:U3 small nucleolar RNA-associated protein 6 homolog [Tubulanus polymorphus]|uniref:U3 small nucleolar RNA-associated protein 6 homolog n=1 Tax=Tubulanus polymorphus TaxID=672921 RepID=UPI003DA674D6
MAEFVEQSIEEMLPELEQMERVGLFTKAETRAILKKRKAFEYKMRRKTKAKEDFLAYIQYEINVLELLKKRRKTSGYHFKKLEIEIAIIHRVHRLFRFATERFRNDITLWLSFIDFSKSRNETSHVGQIYMKMLQIHNKKPDLWILASKWEFEQLGAIETARSLMQRGIRFNPKSKTLWLEYYRLELLNAEKLQKRNKILLAGVLGEKLTEEEETDDLVLNGKIAEVVFSKALDEFPDDVEFCLDFIPIAELFDFTKKHINDIYQRLEQLYMHKEIMWHALACRKLKEITIQDQKPKEKTIRQFEDECFSKYEEAVEQLPTEKMWQFYLETCLKRLKRKSSQSLREWRLSRTLSVFQEASKKDLLNADSYVDWITTLVNAGEIDKACDVATTSTSKHVKSVKLWHMRLTLLIKTENAAELIEDTFNKSIDCTDLQQQATLWKLMNDWYRMTASPKIIDFFESGLLKNREISEPLKEWYLGWCSATGIKKTRKLYQRLSHLKPVSLAFYRRYIDIEMSQEPQKMNYLRQVFEDAINDYGKDDIDIWLDYIRLELRHPEGNPSNSSKLHWRAMKSLDDALTESFTKEYTFNVHSAKQ